jgi:hypothetical protein
MDDVKDILIPKTIFKCLRCENSFLTLREMKQHVTIHRKEAAAAVTVTAATAETTARAKTEPEIDPLAIVKVEEEEEVNCR